jgi:hypothetical protein
MEKVQTKPVFNYLNDFEEYLLHTQRMTGKIGEVYIEQIKEVRNR